MVSPSRPSRGASRERHETWDGMRWTRDVPTDERRYPRTAKSCGPGAQCRRQVGDDASRIAPMTVANAGSPGRARISRKPSRREGRSVSACTCGHAPFAQSFWREGPGCSGHPAFPAPSLFREGGTQAKLGRNAPRERELASPLLFEHRIRKHLRVVPDKRATASADPVPITPGLRFAKVICRFSPRIDSAVWVPAFAGTTSERAFTPRRPRPPSSSAPARNARAQRSGRGRGRTCRRAG